MKKRSLNGRPSCAECGGGRLATRTETRRYTLAGEWSASVEGASVTRCPDCGYEGVGFRGVDQLERTIAGLVIGKSSHLAAQEIQFLRHHLGYTGVRLARLLGVTGPTISRWEHGHETIGSVPDRLLRSIVALRHGLAGWDVEVLAAIEDRAGAPMRLRLRSLGGRWQAAA